MSGDSKKDGGVMATNVNKDNVENKYLCGKCEKPVRDEDKAVGCEVCEVWFHTECEKIPDNVYNFMVQDKAGEQLS